MNDYLFKKTLLKKETFRKLRFVGGYNLSWIETFEKKGFTKFNKSGVVKMLSLTDGKAVSLTDFFLEEVGFNSRFCFSFSFGNRRFRTFLVGDPYSLFPKSVGRQDLFGNKVDFGVFLITIKVKLVENIFGSLSNLQKLIDSEAFEKEFNLSSKNNVFERYFFELLEYLNAGESVEERIRRWKESKYLKEATRFELNADDPERIAEPYKTFERIIVARKVIIPKLAVYEQVRHNLIYTGFLCDNLKDLVACSDFFREYCERSERK